MSCQPGHGARCPAGTWISAPPSSGVTDTAPSITVIVSPSPLTVHLELGADGLGHGVAQLHLQAVDAAGRTLQAEAAARHLDLDDARLGAGEGQGAVGLDQQLRAVRELDHGLAVDAGDELVAGQEAVVGRGGAVRP